MTFFEIVAVLVTLSALFSYFNFKVLKMPTTIGLMALALLFSVGLTIAGQYFQDVSTRAHAMLQQIDFGETLMHGMLGLLLFAGALHVNLGDLTEHKWVIAVLATAGVLISTAVIGLLMWGLFGFFGLDVKFLHCLLFGALISPTDPISVLGILKSLGAPKALEIQVAGESLFNDGVGVVVFLGVLELATGRQFDPGHLALLFLKEAVGGAVFGLAIGLLVYYMLKSVDNYQVEILLSLMLVIGGYALAGRLHVSGPIAMVVAGILIGNQGRSFAMSQRTREHLDTFWELIDEILNAILFVLIGLEVMILNFERNYICAGIAAIFVCLLARFISVGLPVLVLRTRVQFTPHTIKLLTWGGLRGGISVALALSLRDTLGNQDKSAQEIVLLATYIVVAFSILVQGLTVGPLISRLIPTGNAKTPN